MLFAERLSAVRKAKKTSQEELAKAIGVHAPVIGRYERDEVKPSIEVALKIADALATSLDYLVGSTDLLLDKTILNRVMDLQKLKEEDQAHIFAIIDAYMRDAKTKQAYK